MSAIKEHLFKEMQNLPTRFESKWTGPDELELTIYAQNPERTVVVYLTEEESGALADLLNNEAQLHRVDMLGGNDL